MPAAGKVIRAAKKGKVTASVVARHSVTDAGQLTMFSGGGGLARRGWKVSAARAAEGVGQMHLPGISPRNVHRVTTIAKAAEKSGGHFKRNALIAGVVAGGLALNGLRGRSGPAADKVRGRPTGVYGY